MNTTYRRQQLCPKCKKTDSTALLTCRYCGAPYNKDGSANSTNSGITTSASFTDDNLLRNLTLIAPLVILSVLVFFVKTQMPAQASLIDVMRMSLALVGITVSISSWVWMAILATQENVMWLVAFIMFPVSFWGFVLVHWSKAHKAFFCHVLGLSIMVICADMCWKIYLLTLGVAIK